MSDQKDLLVHFQTVGGDIYNHGMVSMHGGNLSLKSGSNLYITRSGSRLGFFSENDLIVTGIDKDDENTSKASSELVVHRAIYSKTPFAAIVHCHPIYAVAQSFLGEKITPQDEAGKIFIPEVPVVGFGKEPVPGGFADEVAEALATHAVVLVHRHGCFARGMTLEEAYVYTELLEISCLTLYIVKNLKS